MTDATESIAIKLLAEANDLSLAQSKGSFDISADNCEPATLECHDGVRLSRPMRSLNHRADELPNVVRRHFQSHDDFVEVSDE